MKKEILIFGIIFLFIGVGIQPAFAIDISNVRPSGYIEDCNCKVDDNYDTVRVKSLLNRAERLINRVEILTKLIPILSKDNPEVIEVCEELSKKIRPLKELNEQFNSDSSFLDDYHFCDNLEKLFDEIDNFWEFLVILMRKSVIMNLLLLPLYIIVSILDLSVYILYLLICFSWDTA